MPDGGGAADPVAVSVHSDGAAVPLATCLTSVSVDFGVYVFVNVQVMPGWAGSGGGGTLVSTTWRAARLIVSPARVRVGRWRRSACTPVR